MDKTEKRIRELRTMIIFQSKLMECISRKRGEYFLELQKLQETKKLQEQLEIQIAQLDVLQVGP